MPDTASDRALPVARAILAIQSIALVMLVSGYVRQTDIDTAAAIGIREVVLKPNTVDELASIVQRLLSSAAAVNADV